MNSEPRPEGSVLRVCILSWGLTLISVTPPPHPGGLDVWGFENRFITHRSSGFVKSFFLATEL